MRRLVRCLVLLVALTPLLGLGLLFARGTWADDVSRDPPPGDASPTVQILRHSDGSRQVRAAIRLAHPPDQVWQAITDYEHYGDLCSFIHGAKVEHGPDGCRVQARADTTLPGGLPFAMTMTHRQELFEYTSTWDEASGAVRVNRGGWHLRPAGDGTESLLALSVEIQVRGVPTWLIRNLWRGRLAHAVVAVRKRLVDGPSGKPW
jgi:hypothetical protein